MSGLLNLRPFYPDICADIKIETPDEIRSISFKFKNDLKRRVEFKIIGRNFTTSAPKRYAITFYFNYGFKFEDIKLRLLATHFYHSLAT